MKVLKDGDVRKILVKLLEALMESKDFDEFKLKMKLGLVDTYFEKPEVKAKNEFKNLPTEVQEILIKVVEEFEKIKPLLDKIEKK